MTSRTRMAAIAAIGLVPWVVVVGRGPRASVGLVFSFGLVNPATLHLTTLPDYLLVLTRGLPESLLAWPVATLLWLGAVTSALSGSVIGREDRRLTAGLLVLAGLSLLPVTLAVGRPPGVTVLPVGTVACWAVVWLTDRDALAAVVAGGGSRER